MLCASFVENSSFATINHSLVSTVLQVGLMAVVALMFEPKDKLRHKVPTEQHVELLCDIPLTGLVLLLGFNILLIILCVVYGFLTRKLPENFSESWYIFVSAATTIFLWLVFLPSYFTAFYAYHQV